MTLTFGTDRIPAHEATCPAWPTLSTVESRQKSAFTRFIKGAVKGGSVEIALADLAAITITVKETTPVTIPTPRTTGPRFRLVALVCGHPRKRIALGSDEDLDATTRGWTRCRPCKTEVALVDFAAPTVCPPVPANPPWATKMLAKPMRVSMAAAEADDVPAPRRRGGYDGPLALSRIESRANAAARKAELAARETSRPTRRASSGSMDKDFSRAQRDLPTSKDATTDA